MADSVIGPIRHSDKREHSISYRKSNKPLMEKRRRARINDCLTQLKSLVLQALKKDSSQFSKLEKADILELTVTHLRNMQRQQSGVAMTIDPSVATKYRAGFNECASEVLRYMSSAQCVSDQIKGNVTNHLANCLQVVNQPTVAQPKQCFTSQNVQLTKTPLTQTNDTPNLIRSSVNSDHLGTAKPSRVILSNEHSSINVKSRFHLVPTGQCSGTVAVFIGTDNVSTSGSPQQYAIQMPCNNENMTSFVPSPTDGVSVNRKLTWDAKSVRGLFPQQRIKKETSTLPVSTPLLKNEMVWRPW